MWKQLFSSVVPSTTSTKNKENGLKVSQENSGQAKTVAAPRGLRRVIEHLEKKRSRDAEAEASSNKKVPSYVVEALGPGWTLRGGLGSGAYAKVFEATWIGDQARTSVSHVSNGGTTPSKMRTMDIFSPKHSIQKKLKERGVDCAIKVMRDVDMESWEISRRFVRELLILRRLRAVDGVVSLYGCRTPKAESSRHKRDLYLFFEACLTDFRQLTKMDVFLTLPDARRLLKELLMAIAHMHASDIIHRDVKPANLLLHADGTLKVCDFGLARVVPPNARSDDGSDQDDDSFSNTGHVSDEDNVLNTQLKHSGSKGMIAPELPPGDTIPPEWSFPGFQTTLHPQSEGKTPPLSTTKNHEEVRDVSIKKVQPDALECKEKDDDLLFANLGPEDDGLREPSPTTKAISRSSSKKKVAFAVDGDGIDEPLTGHSLQSFTSASMATTEDEKSRNTTVKADDQAPKASAPLPRAELRRMYTEHVVTRWYRAPELVLLQPYNGAVDVWAAACVFAECFLGTCMEICPDKRDRRPLFPGRSCYPLSPMGASRDGWHQKNDQLQAIFNVRGTPSSHEIEALENDYRGMKNYLRRLSRLDRIPLETIFPAADPRALDLLEKMLAFSPDRRASVAECLRHDYLRSSTSYLAPGNDPYRLTEESLASRPSGSMPLPPLDGYGEWSPASSRWGTTSNAESRPSVAALGPAMSQLEDDEAWERVAQHEADADMSRVLWKLVDCFPSELAANGGLVGDEDATSSQAEDDELSTDRTVQSYQPTRSHQSSTFDERPLMTNTSDPGQSTQLRQRSASSDTVPTRSTSFLKRRATKFGMLPSQWCSTFLDHRKQQRATGHENLNTLSSSGSHK